MRPMKSPNERSRVPRASSELEQPHSNRLQPNARISIRPNRHFSNDFGDGVECKSENMATEIVNDVSAPSDTKSVESTVAPAAVRNPSDEVSTKLSVDGSKDDESEEGSPAVNDEVVLVTDVRKKMKRAERFGMPLQLSEVEKRNTRAERFGSAANSSDTDAGKSSEDQKRKARAERFGISAETVSDEEAKKKARLAKFSATSKVDSVEDDKRKARALRFSQPSKSAVSNVNDKGKSEPTAAVEAKAGGAA
ncbi:unnamed protein product [Rhodiola kirilowii]